MTILSALLAILLAPCLATAMVGNAAVAFNSPLGGTPEPTAPETLGSFTFGIEPLAGFELLGQRPFSPLDQASPPGDATDRKSNLAADDTSAQADNDRAARRPASPDWPGIGRDTALFVAAQTVSVAVLYALPGDINRWSNKDVSLDNWWHNVRNPEWDNDPWGTNYITHPYWGATYYIRARERGFGKLASFGYSAFLSTIYEYGAEAFFEPPSGQDLLVTPILGSLVGAFVFEPIRNIIKGKPELRWYDHAVLIATDPLGLLSGVLEKMLGIKSDILLQPVAPTRPAREQTAPANARKTEQPRAVGLGVRINIAW